MVGVFVLFEISAKHIFQWPSAKDQWKAFRFANNLHACWTITCIMVSVHHYFARKQVGDTQKRGKPEMCSSCRNSLDLHWSPWPRPGRRSASVPPPSNTCQSVAILMNRRHSNGFQVRVDHCDFKLALTLKSRPCRRKMPQIPTHFSWKSNLPETSFLFHRLEESVN